MRTADQIVVDEIIRWLENSDYQRFTEVQRLEEKTRIWDYGKWCNSEYGRATLPPQIRYSGSQREPTFIDGLQGMSDDDGLRMHAALKSLEPKAFQLIMRVYVDWQGLEWARSRMKMREQDFFALRRSALKDILKFLENAC